MAYKIGKIPKGCIVCNFHELIPGDVFRIHFGVFCVEFFIKISSETYLYIDNMNQIHKIPNTVSFAYHLSDTLKAELV